MKKAFFGLIALYGLTIGLMINGYTVPLMNCEDIPKDYLEGKDYEKCINQPEQYLEEVHNTNILWLGIIGGTFNVFSTLSYWQYTKRNTLAQKGNGESV